MFQFHMLERNTTDCNIYDAKCTLGKNTGHYGTAQQGAATSKLAKVKASASEIVKASVSAHVWFYSI